MLAEQIIHLSSSLLPFMVGLLCVRCCTDCSSGIISIQETCEVGTIAVLIVQMRNWELGVAK